AMRLDRRPADEAPSMPFPSPSEKRGLRTMPWLLAALALAAPPAPSTTVGALTRWDAGRWTVWRIDPPAAGPRAVEYPEIRAAAREVIVLDAPRCADSAVWLPGSAAPVRLGDVARRRITVPVTPDGGRPTLRLRAACSGRGDAAVRVAVERALGAEDAP